MLSEVLRAGPEPTAGLSHLSTPDSILMSYQKLATVFEVLMALQGRGQALSGPLGVVYSRLRRPYSLGLG